MSQKDSTTTVKTSGAPGIIAPHYHVTTQKHSDGSVSKGVGKTPEQSQKNASKESAKRKP